MHNKRNDIDYNSFDDDVDFSLIEEWIEDEINPGQDPGFYDDCEQYSQRLVFNNTRVVGGYNPTTSLLENLRSSRE